MNLQTWKKALKASVIEVGAGRGFVVDLCGKDNPIIITGAHCLPRLTLGSGVDEDGRQYVADGDAPFAQTCSARLTLNLPFGLSAYSSTRFRIWRY